MTTASLCAPRGLKRTRIAAATAAVATTALLAGGAPDAHADANSCAAAPNGYVCNVTKGRGLQVNEVQVVRGKASWSGICSYSASVEVRGPDGVVLFNRGTGVVRDGECVFGRAYITIPVRRRFPPHSKLTTRFYEDGKQQGGGVFVGINH